MINFANEFAKRNKNIEIIIRFHPIISNQDKRKFKLNSQNIKISFSTLKEDCKLSKWLVYSSSTAVYEGISFNCIPIRLNCNLASDLSDPLWQINSNLIHKISTHDELKEFINFSKMHDIYNANSPLMKELFFQVRRLRSNLNLYLLNKEFSIDV